MSALRGLVCFAAGLGIGLTMAMLATPHKGVANRNFLRRRGLGLRGGLTRDIRRCHSGSPTSILRMHLAHRETVVTAVANGATFSEGG